MTNSPGESVFTNLQKKKKKKFPLCLFLQVSRTASPCAVEGTTAGRASSWPPLPDCQQLSFQDVTLVSFSFFQLKTMQMFESTANAVFPLGAEPACSRPHVYS